MSTRRRTATRGWKSKQRRKSRALEFLLARKGNKNLPWNEQQERELSYHLTQGN
jgi:hypothetical protein